MPRDLADIVLTGLDSNLRAIKLKGARLADRRARQDESLVDFGTSLLEIPTLLQKRRDEDEMKSVDEAFTGALLAGGDYNTAAGAMRNLLPQLRSRAAVKHAAERALALETKLQGRRAAAKDAVDALAEQRLAAVRKKIGAGKQMLQPNPMGDMPVAMGAFPEIKNQAYSADESARIAFQEGVSPKDVGLDPVFKMDTAQMQEEGKNARSGADRAFKQRKLELDTELKRGNISLGYYKAEIAKARNEDADENADLTRDLREQMHAEDTALKERGLSLKEEDMKLRREADAADRSLRQEIAVNANARQAVQSLYEKAMAHKKELDSRAERVVSTDKKKQLKLTDQEIQEFARDLVETERMIDEYGALLKGIASGATRPQIKMGGTSDSTKSMSELMQEFESLTR